MGQNYFPPSPEKLTEDAMALKVAVGLTSGKSRNALTKELGISASRVNTLSKSDACIKHMREITNYGSNMAKAAFGAEAEKLVKECMRVIYENLKDNNLAAAHLALKALKVFDESEQIQNDSKLVVVMPGAVVPGSRPIDVTPTEDDNEF